MVRQTRRSGCGLFATMTMWFAAACGSTGGDGAGDGAADAAGAPDAQPCLSDCPTPAPAPVAQQRVIVETVDFVSSTITVRNVSGGAIDTTGWVMYVGLGGTEPFDSTTWADGASYVVRLSGAIEAAGEVAVYSSDDVASSDAIEAFVRWGSAAASATATRESVATGATPPLWTPGEFVGVCSEDRGIVATGPSSRAIGFRSIGTTCFLACCLIDGTCLDMTPTACSENGVSLLPDVHLCDSQPAFCPDERQGACCLCGDPLVCEDGVTVDACTAVLAAGIGSTCAETDCAAICNP